MEASAFVISRRLLRILRSLPDDLHRPRLDSKRPFLRRVSFVLRTYGACDLCGRDVRRSFYRDAGLWIYRGSLRTPGDLHVFAVVVHGGVIRNGVPNDDGGNPGVAFDRGHRPRRRDGDDRHLRRRIGPERNSRARIRRESGCAIYGDSAGSAGRLAARAAEAVRNRRLAMGGADRVGGRDFRLVHPPRDSRESALANRPRESGGGGSCGCENGEARSQ